MRLASEGFHPRVWHQQQIDRIKEKIPSLTEDQVVEVLKYVFTTCHACWENDSGCQCWNDE